MNIDDIFVQIGLGAEHARIYTALVKHGKMRISTVAEFAGLPRTSCYDYFPILLEMGIISEMGLGKSKFFRAQSPQVLLNMLHKRKNELGVATMFFEQEFARLSDIYAKAYDAAAVRQYDSLEVVLNLLVNTSADTGNFVIYSRQSLALLAPMTKRLVRKVIDRCEVLDLDDTQEIAGTDVLKFISKSRVFLINLKTQTSIVIENPDIVKFEKSIFLTQARGL